MLADLFKCVFFSSFLSFNKGLDWNSVSDGLLSVTVE